MSNSTFDFIASWQRVRADDDAQVMAFWEREQANVVGEEASRRTRQIVFRILDQDGELVAVSTAVPKTIPRLRQPMYYYRCFIAEAWRDGKLVRPLLRHSFDLLECWAREHAVPCIGVLLELENPGFVHALQRAYWPDVGFAFIGSSRRGMDLRVRYFRGARLKTPR